MRVTGRGEGGEEGKIVQIIEIQLIWKTPGRYMGGKGLEGGRCTDQMLRDSTGR